MFLYRILSILFLPILVIYICFRALIDKEEKARLLERFAFTSQKKPESDVLWVHAVSVGETNSALKLVDELLQTLPKVTILFTTMSRTSAAIMMSKINDYNGRVIHQFLPLDCYFTVRKFLKFWQPKKAIFIESEIWPNFIYEAKKLGISTVLMNGRISQKSFSHWIFAKKMGIKIFDIFSLIFAQSKEDQARLQKLTFQEVLYLGNLKAQAQDLKFNLQELELLKTKIGARKFWLAASTHAGEEQIVFEVHKKLKTKFPDLLTILAPRHPHRALEIIELEPSLKISRRSLKQEISQESEIYLADTLGELGLFYKLASFVFLGGSLVEVGGHNPFEPAKLKCAIITGDSFFNNKQAFEDLMEQGACKVIKNSFELANAIENFLQNQELAQSQANKAFEAVCKNENLVKDIVKILLSYKN